jgi:hypothetical protein
MRPATIEKWQSNGNVEGENGTQLMRDRVEGENNSILASPRDHLITLSALANTFGGIVRPICFAVFRLSISSNFAASSTGKSAGLEPFRILLT